MDDLYIAIVLTSGGEQFIWTLSSTDLQNLCYLEWSIYIYLYIYIYIYTPPKFNTAPEKGTILRGK